mgnify:FL=1
MDSAGAGGTVLLDMAGVLTMNSACWEAVTSLAGAMDLHVFGLNAACKEVFYSWGVDDVVSVHASEDEFWARRAPEEAARQ